MVFGSSFTSFFMSTKCYPGFKPLGLYLDSDIQNTLLLFVCLRCCNCFILSSLCFCVFSYLPFQQYDNLLPRFLYNFCGLLFYLIQFMVHDLFTFCIKPVTILFPVCSPQDCRYFPALAVTFSEVSETFRSFTVTSLNLSFSFSLSQLRLLVQFPYSFLAL
jgi:hypothetical protein